LARDPRLGDEGEVLGGEVSEGANVTRRVDDHLVPLEGGVQVGDDAHAPAGRIGFAALERQRKDLGRRPVLVAFAERTALALVGRLGLELGARRAGSACSRWSYSDDAPRERVYPQLGVQDFLRARSRNGVSRSIGAGKTMVVDCEEPSSSRVCR